MTSQDQINQAKAVAEMINKIDGISACHVDDWGRFGNFAIIATLPFEKRGYGNHGTFWPREGKAFNLRSISAKIRKAVKGVICDEIVVPTRVYDKDNARCNHFRGYNGSLITIDIRIN